MSRWQSCSDLNDGRCCGRSLACGLLCCLNGCQGSIQQLLLGVTAGGINTLHTLPEPLPPPAPVRVPDFKNLPNFAQLLQQRLRKDP